MNSSYCLCCNTIEIIHVEYAQTIVPFSIFLEHILNKYFSCHYLEIDVDMLFADKCIYYPYRYQIESPPWIYWADAIESLRQPTVEWSDKIVRLAQSEDINTRLLGLDLLSKVDMVKNTDNILRYFGIPNV